MKISDVTLNVLKNFAKINSNILIAPGNIIRTISSSGDSIYAEFESEETFDKEIRFFDLRQFLNVHDMFNSPTLDIHEQFVHIHNDNAEAKYFMASEEVIHVTRKGIKDIPVDVQFKLDSKLLEWIQKSSNILGVENVMFFVEDGKMFAKIFDLENAKSHTMTHPVVCDTELSDTSDFCFVFKIVNFLMIPGDYTVGVSKDIVAKFTNNNSGGKLRYWIAQTKKGSYFGSV